MIEFKRFPLLLGSNRAIKNNLALCTLHLYGNPGASLTFFIGTIGYCPNVVQTLEVWRRRWQWLSLRCRRLKNEGNIRAHGIKARLLTLLEVSLFF